MFAVLSSKRDDLFEPVEIMETVLCDVGATAFNPGMW
jgi:hypothetical protein